MRVRRDHSARDATISAVWFGVRRNSTGTLDTDKLFTGQRLDDTGLYYYNARYYDATIGRFISADAIGADLYNPQTLNRYSYCTNNPLKYVDPSGYKAKTNGLKGDLNGDGKVNVLDVTYGKLHGGSDAGYWVANQICGNQGRGNWYPDDASPGLWYQELQNRISTTMYINLYYPTPDYMPDTSLIGAGLNENAIEYDAITSQSSVSRALQSVFGTIETAGGGIITFTGIVLSALGAPEIGIPLAMTGGALSTNGVQNIQEPIYFYSGGEHGKSYSPYSGLDILWGAGVEAIRATIPGAQFFPSWGDWGLQWNWSTGRLEWR